MPKLLQRIPATDEQRVWRIARTKSHVHDAKHTNMADFTKCSSPYDSKT